MSYIYIHAADPKVQAYLETLHITVECDGVKYAYVRDLEYSEHMPDVLDELHAAYSEFEWKAFGV